MTTTGQRPDLPDVPAPNVVVDPALPTWQEQGEMAREYDQERRQQIHAKAAEADATLLKQTLESLKIPALPPASGWEDQWFTVGFDGTVSARIAEAQPVTVTTGGTDPVSFECLQGRAVWACARDGRVWLRAASEDGDVGDAGPLTTLADAQRAWLDGPPPTPPSPPALASYAMQAERALARDRGYAMSADAVQLEEAITGLTYAVLAVTEHLADASCDLERTLTDGLAAISDALAVGATERCRDRHRLRPRRWGRRWGR